MPTVDVCFDYASPFAYLASEVLPGFAERTGVRLCWRPIEIAQLDNYAAGLPYTTLKRRYVAIDAMRSAEYHGVPIRLPKPHPVRSGPALCLAQVALDDPRFPALHRALFRAAWLEQRDVSAPAVLAACIAAADGPGEDWLARAARPETSDGLAAATAEAEAAGVFGVPSMLLDGELFWGLDSLPVLEWRLGHPRARLAAASRFEGHPFAAAENTPTGARCQLCGEHAAQIVHHPTRIKAAKLLRAPRDDRS